MNAMAPILDSAYRLEDRYLRQEGRVYITGTQALVRLPLMQRALDRANGLNTGGFISGYRGSPLGGYDLALWQASKLLQAENIRFTPGVNEDLAVTAVNGSQQVELDPRRTVDGVFGIWYGKAPGLDRSGDAFKHANAFGTSPHGGVLALAGDDHGATSSTFGAQSEQLFIHLFMPVLHPATIDEFLTLGLWGFAASRFCGAWIGMKTISETVEGAQSLVLPPLPRFLTPADYQPPSGGLNLRMPDPPGLGLEVRMAEKLEALKAFARANPIDRDIWAPARARIGILTVGKTHPDTIEALSWLGLDREAGEAAGIRLRKTALVWPLEADGMRAFAEGLEEIVVVEEKRGVVEDQLRALLYNLPADRRPRIVGKSDEHGAPLLPSLEEIRPSRLAPVLANRLGRVLPPERLRQALNLRGLSELKATPPEGVKRVSYFCSGCPHNTSTKVPEGSYAMGGIGCHTMAMWMGRELNSFSQMGGEGAPYVGRAPFTGDGHVFQQLGDGTYYHSGSLAVRQAIAAGVTMTYKILFNDAVAMTGGQPVDGPISVEAIAWQMRAEGVARIAVVSDNPSRYGIAAGFPPGTTVHHRDDLDAVQRELREIKGVTVLIYEQTCAAEKRRRRKKGSFPDPARRVVINERVCEGCGDCSSQSNCLSVVPLETEFGRKRTIDQSSCNKDFSCLNGFCPSFVTIEGGGLRKGAALSAEDARAQALEARLASLPEPTTPDLDEVREILITGVGGTGVVTIGALITMAAHLEGKGASALDFMGFAQKGGAVMSHVKIADRPERINQARVDRSQAHLLLACDMVVAVMPEALGAIRKGRTQVIANSDELPTAAFVLDSKGAQWKGSEMLATLRRAAGSDRLVSVDAQRVATALLGDSIASNIFLLGFAWQGGHLPVSRTALERAIELNGVAVKANLRAFALGRLAALDPDFVQSLRGPAPAPRAETLAALVERRAAFLTAYQDDAYAARYRAFVEKVAAAERAAAGGGDALAMAVAKGLFKLMAYKDEYEVARLYTDGAFLDRVKREFEGDVRLVFHMAPPVLSRGTDAAGRPRKRAFGPWMLRALKALARFKHLRGGRFDPFGRSAERRMERALIEEYRGIVEGLLPGLDAGNRALAVEIAALAEEIRGYGPVKAENAARVRRQWAALLGRFSAPSPKLIAAE